MSYGWSRDQTPVCYLDPSQQSAADFANSFLKSVGQELQGSSDNHYGHESQGRYSEYHGGDDYRRRDDRDMNRENRHHSSRDRYHDRSRDNRDRRRRSRERRDRSPRHHRRDERDYRRRRRSISPRRSSRRRSANPVRHRDDENIVPLSKRPRKLHNWDMAPAGMEGMTAQQVKMTGLFPLPGQVVGTRTPQSFQPPPVNNKFDDSRILAANTTATKQARRLYVGQIPPGLEEKPLADFFNATMHQLQMQDRTPVAAVQINHEKSYAFVEFQTAEQATACMAFDGIMFQGQQLKIRRPKDYQPPAEGDVSMQLPGLVSTNVPDTPNKIFIGGLPVYLNDDQVIELLKSFGDRKLIVQRASVGAKHIPPDYMSGPMLPANYVPVTSAKEDDATRVLQLMNMVTPEELEDDEEYQDIWEDIAEECAKFGNVLDMKIPKPQKDQEVPGCGLIFVRFETKDQTLDALRALAGRKFADRTVVATFIDEQNYLTDSF
ncbi:hypothetical protein RO3G_15411 [Rhizopus delemar RA 99-880]|uniref:RRM domain-containing protein n=1 Tax=Rhizopus delemar (strain RA 99-880 / ATCC MYA-4621 / FGSC 9543 / NRRL 43880) TaxID=246409 RepID=I1CQH0_RHIO9|nr:hypothetical protein RO3G_15411 [Rhizopus delemar RA 99-880]|eukprot:EIE90700.1 hypothetical protein RO3G_15411 [Rhizopus delemar RA 99-880]